MGTTIKTIHKYEVLIYINSIFLTIHPIECSHQNSNPKKVRSWRKDNELHLVKYHLLDTVALFVDFLEIPKKMNVMLQIS